MNHAYDIAIAYRIYPGNPKIPAIIFPEDKLRLSGVCLRSLKDSLGCLRAKIFVILDGCDSLYENLFTDLFSMDDLIIHHVNKLGNSATFKMQSDWLENQKYSELVYFAEDDYIYLPDRFKLLLDFIKNNENDVDFVTPYDHPDYKILLWHTNGRRHKTIHRDGIVWTQRASTTCTFLTRRSVLQEVSPILGKYQSIGDIGFWAILTMRNFLDIIFLLKLVKRNSERWLVKYFIKALILGFPFLLRARIYKLWAPTLSIATHSERDYLAKGISWSSVINKILKENNF